ncbi:hypothetical protein K8R14_02615 [bacterium]|nr:hypothetical protein [bacterium]
MKQRNGQIKAINFGALQGFRSVEAWQLSHNNALHRTPKARAFLASAISEKNFAFAKSSLAFGAGEFGRYVSK